MKIMLWISLVILETLNVIKRFVRDFMLKYAHKKHPAFDGYDRRKNTQPYFGKERRISI